MNTELIPLTQNAIHAVLSSWTGIAKSHFQAGNDLKQMLQNLPHKLKEHIFGQEQAIETIVNSLQRALLLQQGANWRRPRAVLLFVGPSGVGKTELARVVAEEFYGDSTKYLTRIDMSELTTEHSVARLVGSPPGYVGYGQGGELTNAIKKKRHGVLLLDEIEKAHPHVLTRALLPLIGEGVLHDMNTGELVDAKNFLVLMTSNFGTNNHLDSHKPIGFGNIQKDIKSNIKEAVRKNLPHEFLGRIDQVIVFNPLSKEVAQQIWHKELIKFEKQLSEQYGQITITIDPLAEQILLAQAQNNIPTEGARVVHKVFKNNIVDQCLNVMVETNNDNHTWRIEVSVTPDGNIRLKRKANTTTTNE